ncbi:Acyl-CoA dehydrogenase/oxidase C-terminal [Candidatus Planktophila versatilis]|uniref:acyl-CoA dehydrogenase family protein n=1 Tax=Candidatus Planktophila versatilis TaxID=1884905 RepID=UPI003BEEFEFE
MTTKTRPSEVGIVLASAIRDAARKSIGKSNVATYAEKDSPISWNAISQAGWDTAGVLEDGEGISTRDLVEIAQAWGESCLPLPLIPTILAKRYSIAAAHHSGPVTFSIGTQTQQPNQGLVPFGSYPGIVLVSDFSQLSKELSVGLNNESDDFAPTLQLAISDHKTKFTQVFADEIAAIWAGEASGIARKVLRESVEYAKNRNQFGKPIGSFQAVKHHLANAHIATEFAETAAIWASLEPVNAKRASLHGIDQSIRAVELGIQVHGGMGFTWEMGLHFYLRHLQTLRELVQGVSRNV